MTDTSDNTFDPKQWLNLADASLGAKAIYVTDDFFAEVNRMLNPQEPVWKEDLYDDNGKWMDGWESRRKRVPGHDYAVVRLATAGQIEAIDLDTRFFTGNYPPEASIEACFVEQGDPTDQTEWTEVLPTVSLSGDSHHLFTLQNDSVWTHLRIHIYPDGGIARLRVYGKPYKNWQSQSRSELIDLAALLNGGYAISCSDSHYGDINNLMKPGSSPNMGDGWETARRRGPGYDWVIVRLGHAGAIKKIIVDTQHFKGNYPHSCAIQAANLLNMSEADIDHLSEDWKELLPKQLLGMDQQHVYMDEINDLGDITHIRLNIYPDGGVSRLRLLGFCAE